MEEQNHEILINYNSTNTNQTNQLGQIIAYITGENFDGPHVGIAIELPSPFNTKEAVSVIAGSMTNDLDPFRNHNANTATTESSGPLNRVVYDLLKRVQDAIGGLPFKITIEANRELVNKVQQSIDGLSCEFQINSSADFRENIDETMSTYLEDLYLSSDDSDEEDFRELKRRKLTP
jgi:hypothetical protein